MEGYIKDWRQELESDVWLMPPLYHRIWQWLKYTANHKDKYIPMHDGSKTLVKRGQKLTSIRSIAEGVGWYERGVFKKPNPKTVQDVLNWLAKNGMITIDTSNRKYTLITIVNYSVYQANNSDKSNSKYTVSIQSLDTNNNDNNINNNAYAAASEIDEAINFYIEYFNDHNPSNLSQIESYMDDMQPTLVKKAMEIAIERDKRFFRYVRGILESWLSKGIKTIEEYEREELHKPQQKEENFGGPYVPNAEETRKMMDELLRGMKYENTAP